MVPFVVTNRIHFRWGPVSEFDLVLRGNLVIVSGESAQGKTYFFNSLYELKKSGAGSSVVGFDLDRVVFLNIYTEVKDILSLFKTSTGKLFILDNADRLLTSAAAEYMGWDIRNQYLVFARGDWPYGVSPNYYATMVKKDGKHILDYPFFQRGWV